MKQFISYAQNREDAIIDAYFKDVKKGFYVDIGAHHPIQESVTKSFYDRGWCGINVEPNPQYYNWLVEDRPHDQNIQTGISNRNGKLHLRVYKNSGLSTFSDDIKEDYKRRSNRDTSSYEDIEVPVITLKDLFKQTKPPHIHFLKIDAEGFEREVLEGNDWEKYRPEVICIEANHKINEWGSLLKKNDYDLVWNDGLNDYYLAKESASRKANFSYAEDMLTDRQVIAYHVLNRIEEERTKNRILKIKNHYLEEMNTAKDIELSRQKTVKRALKALLTAVDSSIKYRISSLLINKKMVRNNPIPHPLSSVNQNDPIALLRGLNIADLLNYYSTRDLKRRTSPWRWIAFQLLQAIYFLPRGIAIKLYRLLVKR